MRIEDKEDLPIVATGSKSLRDLGIYLLMDSISDASVKPIIEWIVEENYAKDKKEFLQLFINSPGGACNACFSLTDFMAHSSIPIRTTGIGQIASCGFLIFIAGQKGYRTITPNTSILSHQYSWGSGGKHHDLVADRKEQDMTFQRMKKHYELHLTPKKGNKAKIIQELLQPSDTWLTADEAMRMGVADKIINKF